MTFAIRLKLATTVGGPILTDDGAGYLGNARWLAGVSTPDFTYSNAYGLGYPVLLAPFYAVGVGPEGIVLAARVINAALASLIAIPLALSVRTLWPQLEGTARWIGVAVSLSPALLLQPAFPWPESLLPLLFACWALVVVRYVTAGGRWAMAAVVSLGVLAALTHDRAMPVVIVTFLILGADVVKGGTDRRRTALLGIGALAVGVLATRVLVRLAVAAMWTGTAPTSAQRGASLLDKVSPDRWKDLVRAALGQGWYAAVASLGLVIVGAVVLADVVRGHRSSSSARARLAWGAILLAAAGLLALSVVFMSAPRRADQVVYGRYNEMWIPLISAVGLGAILHCRRARSWGPIIAVSVPLVGVVAWLIIGEERVTGSVMSLNILGVVGSEVLLNGQGTWIDRVDLVGSAILAGAGLGLVVVAARFKAGPLAVAAVFLIAGYSAHDGSIEGFRSFWYGHTRSVALAVEAAGATEPVAVELTVGRAPARNMLAFWLGDDAIESIGEGEWATRSPGTLVLGGGQPADECLDLVSLEPVGNLGLWLISEECLAAR